MGLDAPTTAVSPTGRIRLGQETGTCDGLEPSGPNCHRSGTLTVLGENDALEFVCDAADFTTSQGTRLRVQRGRYLDCAESVKIEAAAPLTSRRSDSGCKSWRPALAHCSSVAAALTGGHLVRASAAPGQACVPDDPHAVKRAGVVGRAHLSARCVAGLRPPPSAHGPGTGDVHPGSGRDDTKLATSLCGRPARTLAQQCPSNRRAAAYADLPGADPPPPQAAQGRRRCIGGEEEAKRNWSCGVLDPMERVAGDEYRRLTAPENRAGRTAPLPPGRCRPRPAYDDARGCRRSDDATRLVSALGVGRPALTSAPEHGAALGDLIGWPSSSTVVRRVDDRHAVSSVLSARASRRIAICDSIESRRACLSGTRTLGGLDAGAIKHVAGARKPSARRLAVSSLQALVGAAVPTSRTTSGSPSRCGRPLRTYPRGRGRAAGPATSPGCNGGSSRRAARASGPGRAHGRRCAQRCGPGSR